MVTPQQFLDYMNKWDALNRECYRIPSWRHIKQLRNIRAREKLTREFERLTNDQ